MSSNLKIAVAQLNLWPGALRKNFEKIKQVYLAADARGCDLLVTTELALCGYPLYDHFLRAGFAEQVEVLVGELRELTKGRSCALVVGYCVDAHLSSSPSPRLGGKSRRLRNVISVLANGDLAFTQAKSLLPNFDVFDEGRYFLPAEHVECFDYRGHRILFSICEDVWGCYPDLHPDATGVYPDLLSRYRQLKPSVVVVSAASPYEWRKAATRRLIHKRLAEDLAAPLVYANQVGAVDELIFDGGSFGVFPGGGVQIPGKPTTLNGSTLALPFFDEGVGHFQFGNGPGEGLSAEWMPWLGDLSSATSEARVPDSVDPLAVDEELELGWLAEALVLGVRDYFLKSGFKSAILGLSGGIDSALVAVLASRALGPRNVLAVAMPSQFSSSHSLEDAELLAMSLGVRYEVKPIKFLYSTSCRELSEGRGALAGLASENLQARLRGNILMTLANHEGALVLATGNKSELAMGYCTLYGDMSGALAPIGDLFKTRVYQLSRWINRHWGSPIPDRSLTKPPSAELRPNQTDQDSLPPYEVLDAVLYQYLEVGLSLEEVRQAFLGVESLGVGGVGALLSQLEINEYKRKQAAPVLKVSAKSFGIGRRVPLVSRTVRG